jgi:hypothetical protein
LPVEATSFIGRRDQLADARKKLVTARLLSLVGPGGVGTTRLAVRVATDLGRGFPGGAWLVELAEAQDPRLLDGEAQSLAMASIAANMAGDRGSARRLPDRAQGITESLDDLGTTLMIHQARALNGFVDDDLGAVRSAAAQGTQLSREANDLYSLGMMLMNQGFDVFLSVLQFALSDLATSPWQRALAQWVAWHDQNLVGRGVVGFDLEDIAWDPARFPERAQWMAVWDTRRWGGWGCRRCQGGQPWVRSGDVSSCPAQRGRWRSPRRRRGRWSEAGRACPSGRRRPGGRCGCARGRTSPRRCHRTDGRSRWTRSACCGSCPRPAATPGG